jgi:predicted nucleic acid-binding protein
MGQLDLQDGAIIYVDSAIFIYTLQSEQKYFSILNVFWAKFQSRKIEIVTSELTLMEILVQPLKLSDSQRINGYERFLTESDIQLVPISRKILKEAAQLRSIKSIKTPDAIHASTAIHHGCTMFFTNDRGFQNTPGLQVIILDQVVDS